jgi:hypothetical protein
MAIPEDHPAGISNALSQFLKHEIRNKNETESSEITDYQLVFRDRQHAV